MSTTTKKPLNCSVITKEGPIIRALKIEHIEIPSHTGYVSIYSNHCPYIISINYGELKIYDEEKNLINMYVEGGIAEMSQNTIVVLVEKATLPKDIDANDIKQKINELAQIRSINSEETKRIHLQLDKYKKQLELVLK